MRMIDGKPEYKNGLVRRQGWGAWVRMCWVPGEGEEGAWV